MQFSKLFLAFTLVGITCWLDLAWGSAWMAEQIHEDLQNLPARVTTRQLGAYFEELAAQGEQALYCEIRNREISWKIGPRTDLYRNPHIFRFFQDLADRYPLPDTDFILLSGDGCIHPMKFPVFSFSATAGCQACLIPDFEMFWEIKDEAKDWRNICLRLSSRLPWKKKRSLSFFRGAGTGTFIEDGSLHFQNDRMRVICFSAEFPYLVDAAFSVIHYAPMQKTYESIGKSLGWADIRTHFAYKYLLDIDGNANTYSRCRWILLSNSVLLKVMSPIRQWYYKAMEPWVHYVPVQQDLSNLHEVLHTLITDDQKAESIALSGQNLGLEIFSPKAVESYMVCLLQAYARRILVVD